LEHFLIATEGWPGHVGEGLLHPTRTEAVVLRLHELSEQLDNAQAIAPLLLKLAAKRTG
jgi:hypothetical protein